MLLLDRDERFLKALAKRLEDQGFKPVCRSDRMEALNWLERGGVCSCILIRWHLPTDPGPAFVRQVRDARSSVPVIVFTAADVDLRDADLRNGHAHGEGPAGALAKSRRFPALLAHLRSALDATKADDRGLPEKMERGNLLLFPRSRRVHWLGKDVPLTGVEYRVVEKLALKAGDGFVYREIFDVVQEEGFWVGHGGERLRANAGSIVDAIRLKFRAADDAFDMIESHGSKGFRWRGFDPQTAIRTRYEGLTAREREVMHMVVGGLANKETAARLEISQRTVEHHRASIMNKMGADSLADLVRMHLVGELGEVPGGETI